MTEIQMAIEQAAGGEPGEKIIRNFATVGQVFEDGVSLIFDGESEPTQKHYLCNTNIFFSAGDRVRISEDSGTYVVEYVVGPPRQTKIEGIPAGGSAGNVLTKNTAGDYDANWKAASPAAAVENQINSLAAYAIQLRTTNIYLNPPVFQIRIGAGAWYTIGTT